MSHHSHPDFWSQYHRLPQHIQDLADHNFELLKSDPRHPSLHLKKVGRHWSVRVGIHYRAVGVESPQGIMKGYRKAHKTIEVSVGESVRIMRELQELSQADLAALTGIAQSTISAIENDRINLGVERAKALAIALKCHPAVLVFPGWEIASLQAA